MKTKTIEYIETFALVFSAVIGLIVGMIFIWIGLVEKEDFIYFIAGFIMVIFGMMAMVGMFSAVD